MRTNSADSVEVRLDRLEKENQRLKLAGLGLAIGLVGIFAGGAAFQDIPAEFTARKLVIVGPDNDPRVVLDVFNDGGAGVSILRPDNGGRAVALGFNKDRGGSLRLWDNANLQTFIAPQ
jgi:hypothetical protein